jgi:hypothetical protein
MLGTSLVLGVSVAPEHALMQGAGTTLRMSAAAFVRHCGKSAELRGILARYVYVLMRQLAQTAACTRHHLVEARLARWLLNNPSPDRQRASFRAAMLCLRNLIWDWKVYSPQIARLIALFERVSSSSVRHPGRITAHHAAGRKLCI